MPRGFLSVKQLCHHLHCLGKSWYPILLPLNLIIITVVSISAWVLSYHRYAHFGLRRIHGTAIRESVAEVATLPHGFLSDDLSAKLKSP